MKKSAIISDCGKYRYELRRIWDDELPLVNFIGLNPSTADAEADDPTIRRCIQFGKDWGFGGLIMTNLFAYRATKPSDMAKYAFPDGPKNWEHLQANAIEATIVVAAWTTHKKAIERQKRARTFFEELGVQLHYLRLNDNGTPEHPLYLPKDLMPIVWK